MLAVAATDAQGDRLEANTASATADDVDLLA
jgi:hypothetical protein